MRPTLIAGNWKMNGSMESVIELVEGIKSGNSGNAQLAVCPPAVYLMKVGGMLNGSDIALGAQNVCDQEAGAYTGEISASMLKECACQYAIVGHSERRALYQESDELVARRFATAVASGLTPILCVGETLQQREDGITKKVVAGQLDAVIEQQGVAVIAQAVIAYEPVWAIGTGRTPTNEEIASAHDHIRACLQRLVGSEAAQIRLLYGGSMKPENATAILAIDNVDGGLIGGASLKASDFCAIADATKG
jgi:triosephosphate isomerase